MCRGFRSLAVMGAAGKRAASQALQPLLLLRLFLLQLPPGLVHEVQSPALFPKL